MTRNSREFSDEVERDGIENLRKFLDEVLEPEIRRHGEVFIPKEKMIAWSRQLSDCGLLNAPFPEGEGGLGLSWRLHVQLLEELAY